MNIKKDDFKNGSYAVSDVPNQRKIWLAFHLTKHKLYLSCQFLLLVMLL